MHHLSERRFHLHPKLIKEDGRVLAWIEEKPAGLVLWGPGAEGGVQALQIL